jgi:tetratricopeptide (TPR) repeat protein
MKLDPFHPTVFHIIIADYHFDRAQYEEALAAALKVDAPDYFWTEILLAGIYAELGEQDEAARALEELLRLYPGFTIQTLIEEWKKWNASDGRIRRSVAALRKAGLPE